MNNRTKKKQQREERAARCMCIKIDWMKTRNRASENREKKDTEQNTLIAREWKQNVIENIRKKVSG